MNVIDKATGFLFGFVVCALCAAGIWVWSTFKPSLPAVLGEAPAKFVDAKTKTENCKTVEAMADKVKKEVGLSAQVQKDTQSKVLAVVMVPESNNPLYATSLLNLGTGIGEIHFTPQPLPWLSAKKRTTIYADYGLGGDEVLAATWHLGVGYEFAQTKSLHWNANGHLFSTGFKYVGIGGLVQF